MQTKQATDPKAPQLPEGITDLYLRSAVLRVRRFTRRVRREEGAGRRVLSVPRHIQEKAEVVRRFMEGQQGTPV